MRKLFTILLIGVALTSYCQPTEPILRIETGTHISTINKISTDALGKYILTCSNDKTARLWDAENGTLLNTFRIPIGPMLIGVILACEISPDGKIVAVGGFTGYEGDETYCIYIINIQTGKINFRIKQLSEPITGLKFSPDGNLLAAGFLSGEVQVYNSQNWDLIHTMKAFEGSINCLTFDKSNRLAVVSDGENKLIVFDKNFRLEAQTAFENPPNTLSFSKDNKLLAIGFANNSPVEVLDSKSLSLLYRPDPLNIALDGAVFSTTSGELYGRGRTEHDYVCRIWEDYGKGPFTDIPLLKSFIMDVITLPGGKIAAAGYDGELALLQGQKINWSIGANKNSYSQADNRHFRINNNGTIIGLTPDYDSAFTFDVLNRRLLPEQSKFPFFSDNNKVLVTSWDNRNSEMPPKINGIPATFITDNGESSTGVDISADGTEVVLAGQFSLWKADSKANLIWRGMIPSLSYGGVNISDDNKMVAVILIDGTVRWFSMKDGKELLALYIDKSKKKWVLFTPSGYYDASPGAEEMLGWHINNRLITPSFFPVSRFKEQFYRPDIIDAIFETYNETDAITLSNSRRTKKIVTTETSIRGKLPPTITISSPANGSNISSNTVIISYTINSPEDAPAKNLRVLVDGRPVATERGLKPTVPVEQKITATVPSKDCIITLLAENDNGTSPETNLYLKWTAPVATNEEFNYKPKLYVLVIGVSDYNNPDFKLGFAAKDASDFSSTIAAQKGLLYADVIVKKLINKEATKDAITDGLDWIQKQTGQKDIAMIYYAGHGINDNNGIFYMVPVAADFERIRTTCLNFEELKQTVSSIAGKVVVFIDACHSGNVMGSSRRGGIDINAIVNELSSTENGAITFTSSTGKEFSLEDPAWGNGAFTKAVIEGLRGKAEIPGKSKITVKSLDAYISERVKELTKGKQHPTSVSPPNVPDFPIAVTQ